MCGVDWYKTIGSQTEEASMNFDRRRLLRFGVSSVAIATPLAGWAQSQLARPARVAAIQYEPKPGDVAENLRRAERLVREAIDKKAQWIVLPEFFPTGTGFHPSLYSAYQPVDGLATQFLKQLAQDNRVYLCGSFMATSGGDAYNTQVLVTPDGSVLTHDKDFPTMAFESSYYAGGEDAAYVGLLTSAGARAEGNPIASRAGSSAAGAFAHDGLGIGTALCWEIVRFRTATRLAGNIDVLLTSSGWWTADPDGDWPGLSREQARAGWSEHQTLIDAAPRSMARMLGVPVVHANFTGPNVGYTSAAFDRAAPGRYLGSSQIVDAQGNVIARLATQQGVLVADVLLGRQKALDPIGSDLWLPEVTDSMRRRWASTGVVGRNHYLRTTRTKLKG